MSIAIAEKPKPDVEPAAETESKPRRRPRRWWRVLRAMLVVGLCAWLGLRFYFQAKDREHQRFFKTGSTMASWLKDYAHGVKDAYKAGDVSALLAFYSDNYEGRTGLTLRPDGAELATRVWRLEADSTEGVGRTQLASEWRTYFDGIAEVERVKCKIGLIEEVEHDERITLTVRYLLDGIDRDGRTFQDRFVFRWTVRNEGTAGKQSWKIVQDEVVEGVRVAGERKDFQPIALQDIGLDYKHERDPHLNPYKSKRKIPFGVIQHAAGGVSAVDYDRDGRPDLFFADGVRSRLFRNVSENGQLRFLDVTQELGLDGIDRATSGLFADFDNDGDRDLFVLRYMAPCRYYRFDGEAGKFVDATDDIGLDLELPAISGCVADFDRDGYVDIYVGGNGNAFEQIPRLPFFARNGEPNRLFRNRNGRSFEDVTGQSGTGNTGWALACTAGDFDDDGYPDIAIANDFGRKVLYRNNRDGTFTDVAKQAGVLDFSGGMGVAFGDVNNDGRLDLYTSNIQSGTRWYGEEITINAYMRNAFRTRWGYRDFGEYRRLWNLLENDWRELGKMVGEGNSLFQNNGNGTFRELKNSHTNEAGWGWGICLFDADLDGDTDLYAANGWITNKPHTDL